MTETLMAPHLEVDEGMKGYFFTSRRVGTHQSLDQADDRVLDRLERSKNTIREDREK